MNNVYEAKYSKVKKIIGDIPVGEVVQTKVPGEDTIKFIFRHSKNMVTIQHMDMTTYWLEMMTGVEEAGGDVTKVMDLMLEMDAKEARLSA